MDEQRLLLIPLKHDIVLLPGMNIKMELKLDPELVPQEQRRLFPINVRLFFVPMRNQELKAPDNIEDFFRYGTIGEIGRSSGGENDNVRKLTIHGKERGLLTDLEVVGGQLYGYVEEAPQNFEDIESTEERAAAFLELKERVRIWGETTGKVPDELLLRVQKSTDFRSLLLQLGALLPMDRDHRLALLYASDSARMKDILCDVLQTAINTGQVRSEVEKKVRAAIDKNQRDYILREQMKVIREELGEGGPSSEADEFEQRLAALEAGQSVKDRIKKEIARYRNLGANSAEASVSRTYIETLLEMPWDKVSVDRTDLARAREILNEDHYGLEKVKERVLEFLAVRMMTKKADTPILCLVGPPGTGKTSIARSVARALEKKYVRISLGGIRDEAEIRGHRRTYIGAIPGRIAAGIRSAGVSNPLMLLDEIDKTSSDYKGDTASALLEVLDSEQNCRFHDHYIEIPLDLSRVLFIATANDAHTIPTPLKDRMEMIEVTSYTENEKRHIAMEHLLKKQLERHGLDEEKLCITQDAISEIISGYTREAGVRQLERKIGDVCRKAVREILEEKKTRIVVDAADLEHYLGRRIYRDQEKKDRDEIGIARGLAWTSVGGDTLQIEVNVMPGKGDLQLTGKLGDVMKESARTGMSYIRSVARDYGIDPASFQEKDIHIHIPEGAVPKDGPSAGITIATATLSALTGIPVRVDTAMTGEITLRGRVLPVGGLKEKLLAAAKAGIKTVLVPAENKAEIEEISEEITGGLRLIYVRSMEEVLAEALARSY